MAEGPTYDRLAGVYAHLANLWSLGRVGWMKRAQLASIGPGENVLYVGVGPGDDAVAAAGRGADVTALDLSPKMIDEVRGRFEAAGLAGSFVVADLFTYRPDDPFDVVVANFVLDCIPSDRLEEAVGRLASFLRPRGRLLIADAGVPRGSLPARVFWYGYQGIAFAFSYLQGLTPWLPRYDYERELRAAGCSIHERQFVRLWPRGPVTFEMITAVRDDTGVGP